MNALPPIASTASHSLEKARLEEARRVAASATSDRGDGQPVANDMAGLKQVAKQFESLFYGQLLASLRSSVPDNPFWGQGSGTKIYQQMHDEQMADRLADAGGLGIADLIIRQLGSSVSGGDGDAPARIPTQGPPLPPSLAPQAGVGAYRRQGEAGERIAAMVRLRRQAEDLGGAVADTLGRYQGEIGAAAERTNLHPGLVLAVVMAESGGDPDALSPKGARGLMQLMPETAREVGVADAADPQQNLHGGSRYLARMLQRFDGDLDHALAAYNAGPGAVERAGGVPEYPETQRYVAKVKDLAQRLGADVGTNLVTGPGDGPNRTP